MTSQLTPAKTLACAAVAALALGATAAPAQAAGPRAKPASFSLHGVVVAKTGSQVRVLVKSAKIGGKTVRNTVRTVTVTPRTRTRVVGAPAGGQRRAAGLPTTTAAFVGASITVTGTVQGGTLVAASETLQPVPAEALYGRVAQVSGSLLVVAARDEARTERHGHGDATVVDLTAATVSGTSTSVAGITAGKYVVVLGENEDHLMAAARVFVFDDAPQILLGRVSAVGSDTGTATVALEDRRDDDEDGSGEDARRGEDDARGSGSADGSAEVGLGSAQVVVNGNDSGRLTVGDLVLVVGPSQPAGSTGPVPALLVFAFDAADRGPVGSNSPRADGHDGVQDHDGGHHDGAGRRGED